MSAFGPAADLQKRQELTTLIITAGSSSPLTYFRSSSYQPFCGHLQDLRWASILIKRGTSSSHIYPHLLDSGTCCDHWGVSVLLDEPCRSNCAAFLALQCGILPRKGLDRITVLYQKACIISSYQVCQNENWFPAALVQPLSCFLKCSDGVGSQTGCNVYQGDRYPFRGVIFWSRVSA